jgi:hypothetical protein
MTQPCFPIYAADTWQAKASAVKRLRSSRLVRIEPRATPRQPSSRTGLLPSSPLRTGHESFLSHQLKPFECLFRGDAVSGQEVVGREPGQGTPDEVERGSQRWRNHSAHADAIVNPPTRDPGDSFLAGNAEAAWLLSGRAKYTRTSERVTQLSPIVGPK